MSLKTFRLIHISDPHFGTTTPEKISLLTKTINKMAPDCIALSGDITQRARRDQFIAARAFCDSLMSTPIIAVPGNHDIPMYNWPARILFPYFGFKNYLKFPLQDRKSFGAIELLGLNSTSPFRVIQGKLRKSSLAQVHSFDGKSLFRVVVLHHPMDCPKGSDEKNILRSASQNLPHFESAKIDLVLSGHIHDPIARLSSARYSDTQRPMPIVLAGTCLSSRTRSDAPNSFNLIEINLTENAVDLDVIRYDLTSQETFLPLTETKFKRIDRDQWMTAVKNESLMSGPTNDKQH